MLRLRTAPPGPDAGVMHRAAGDPPEVRDGRRLCFYAAVFNRYATITEGGRTYRETIRPGAFRSTLAAARNDVYACVEHAAVQTFARRSTGLVLQEDGRGLFASCYLPEGDPFADQVLTDVRAGKYRGCSFAFRTTSDRWHAGGTPGGPPLELCEVLGADLVDVCVTANPAYRDTAVSVRADRDRDRGRRIRLLKLRG